MGRPPPSLRRGAPRATHRPGPGPSRSSWSGSSLESWVAPPAALAGSLFEAPSDQRKWIAHAEVHAGGDERQLNDQIAVEVVKLVVLARQFGNQDDRTDR